MRHLIQALFCLSTLGTAWCQNTTASVSTPPATPPGWDHVEQLQVDQTIAVLERGNRAAFSCRVDRVDDAVLACIRISPYAPSRTVVYPIASVAAVYTEEFVQSPRRAELIVASAAGAALGGVLGGQVSVTGGLAGAGVGGLLGLSTALGRHDLYPRPPRLQRKLLYAAP